MDEDTQDYAASTRTSTKVLSSMFVGSQAACKVRKKKKKSRCQEKF
jgi:hypothetical protein